MKENTFKITNYLKKYSFLIFLYIFIYLLASACTVLITIGTAEIVELITNEKYQIAIYYSLGVIGLLLVQRFSWWVTDIIYYKVSANVTMEINQDLSKQAFKLNSKTYADHNTGTFVQRIVHDPEMIVSNLSEIFVSISDLLTSIVVFVYIATLNVYISLLLVVLVVIATGLEYWRVHYRRGARFKLRRKRDKVHSLTTEIVRSEKDIKSMGLEEKLSEQTLECYRDYNQYDRKINTIDLHLWSLRNLIINAGTMAILILGITFIEKGLIGLATYMIVFSNRNSIFDVVWGFGRIGNMLADIKISNQRMSALFDEKEFVTEKFGNKPLLNVSGGGSVVFKDVSYTYYEYDYESEEQEQTPKKKKTKAERKLVSTNHLFEKLSFEIKPNTTVAFVGKSGSGKSTILNLMSKMYDADSGEILINGENIQDISKDSLRKTISLVNQFPYIFDMTIKENLLLAKRDATDEEIYEALKSANLDEFVATLPLGINTKVGESGIKLSGGQKQRLAIARALLRNSNIIIFDESTSSLDNFAQEEVKKSIDSLKGKSTIVIVAHRLSTIKNVDHIFFLDNGTIVDEGTFDELFERNITFKTMFMAENI